MGEGSGNEPVKQGSNSPGPEVIKLFSCSFEFEILTAHKYQNSQN